MVGVSRDSCAGQCVPRLEEQMKVLDGDCEDRAFVLKGNQCRSCLREIVKLDAYGFSRDGEESGLKDGTDGKEAFLSTRVRLCVKMRNIHRWQRW